MAHKLRILEGARALLERGWNQGYAAQNAAGFGVSYHARNARSWCLVGALKRADWDIGVGAHTESYLGALWAVSCARPLRTIGGINGAGAAIELNRFNDFADRTADEVIAVVDRAIAHVETEVV